MPVARWPADGGRLAGDRRGRDDGEQLAFVHGFTQTRASWSDIRRRFDDRYATVAVDAPGHGDSAAVDVDLDDGAAALGNTVGRAVYVGYSMGGRLVAHLAVADAQRSPTERVGRGFVLVSATGGIDDESERAARRAADDRLASEIEADGVDAFLTRWLALPLFAGLSPDAAQLDERRTNTPAGLAASLRRGGTGEQRPLWDELATVTAPVLVIAGADDAKFTVLGERLADALPNATLAIIAGSGHTVHLEQPDRLATVLDRWLTTQQL